MQFLFLMTHIGSGVESFTKSLTIHPDIDLFETPDNWIYDSYESFVCLAKNHHKAMHSACIYMDIINYNYKFQRNMIFPDNKFLFFLGNPKQSINKICNQYGSETSGLMYYLFRLQGLYEFAIRTNGLIIHDSNIDMDHVSSYLNLRSPIKSLEHEEQKLSENVSYGTIKKAQEAYDDFSIKTANKV